MKKIFTLSAAVAAVIVLVAIAFEAFLHVVDFFETGVFKRRAGFRRARAAAADQQDRLIHARFGFDLGGEVRIDFPVGRFAPRDVYRADRMADEEKFDFAAHIDQHRIGMCLQKFVRLFRFEMLHRVCVSFWSAQV